MNRPERNADKAPTVSDTFHAPCHACGQAVEVVDGEQQPHTCRTYETDSERICAAYWAGFNRANLSTGVNGGRGTDSLPNGADAAPDEPKGRAHAPAPVDSGGAS